MHEGEATTIPATFDANAKTLTFETDKFSAYAIAYKDTAVGTSGGSDSGADDGNGSSANGDSNGSNDAEGDNAAGVLSATGDSIGAFVALALCVVVLAAGILGARHCWKPATQRGKHASR